ncbi:MAG: bifunctional phosphopantothenoylcysteine decarboxylase/phosphopantothenate--cysteine ligase CoaBC, partial [candidate division Zixibacteria bacterium]|nr:bifunctional phosphopantothenoylcysteine decarboxylase/phosphopantothenate--cysteine ligase CoaBC [candidate division Zixibacteria bacterium]
EMFPDDRYVATHHISYAEWADLIVVAPATGNFLGKVANGIADDLLTTIVMAKQSDVMIATAMNTEMFNNPIVQENIAKLQTLGYLFVMPESGELACHTVGVGRLEEPEDIFKRIVEYFGRKQSLAGKKVIVTAGPTIERIDPVRFISNFSSGKMGYALAAEAAARGAPVTLISGPTTLPTPANVKRLDIESAQQLHDTLRQRFAGCDILIMAAAVADFRPAKMAKTKISHPTPEVIDLAANPDILAALGKQKKPKQITVGFALEVDSSKANAVKKLKSKNLDFIVLNNPTKPGIEFGSDFNEATILLRNGKELVLERMSKSQLAAKILDQIEKLRKK